MWVPSIFDEQCFKDDPVCRVSTEYLTALKFKEDCVMWKTSISEERYFTDDHVIRVSTEYLNGTEIWQPCLACEYRVP
jgi:hypothetical protein